MLNISVVCNRPKDYKVIAEGFGQVGYVVKDRKITYQSGIVKGWVFGLSGNSVYYTADSFTHAKKLAYEHINFIYSPLTKPHPFNMQIKIGGIAGAFSSQEWRYAIELLRGEWLVVDTDFLFSNQFNTYPLSIAIANKIISRKWLMLPNMTTWYKRKMVKKVHSLLCGDNGLRVMDDNVIEIKNDCREGLGKCNYCGKTILAIHKTCPLCHQGKIKPFKIGNGLIVR